MRQDKYVALDVDSANIVAGVYDWEGKVMMESFLRNKAQAIREFFQGLSGTVHVTFEEGSQAAYLYEVIQPLVAEVVVCDPRQNKLLKAGNKSDRIDIAKLGKLLRLGDLRPVYQGQLSHQGLKQLQHSYETLIGDRTRTKNRLKALYSGRGVSCKGKTVYDDNKRAQWLQQLPGPEWLQRAELLYAQLDQVQQLSRQAKEAFCRAARQHPAYKWIRSVPGIGPIRAAQILAVVITPQRFRGKRQFWPYCGLAVITRTSSDYEWVNERVKRKRKPVQTRGLNRNYNRTLKMVFKGAAASAVLQHQEFKTYQQQLCAKGMRPEMAQLTIARKLSAIVLRLWQKGERYDPQRLKQAVAGTGHE